MVTAIVSRIIATEPGCGGDPGRARRRAASACPESDRAPGAAPGWRTSRSRPRTPPPGRASARCRTAPCRRTCRRNRRGSRWRPCAGSARPSESRPPRRSARARRRRGCRRPPASARADPGSAAVVAATGAATSSKIAPTVRAIARHGLKARNRSPKTTLIATIPSQTVTKTKVTEKLRSGASVPVRPDQTTTPSRATPAIPARMEVTRLTNSRESHGASGRQSSCSSRVRCQATERATKETIRTSDAPQANSHSGIGRSWRPTSAWPTTRIPSSASGQPGFTVISASGTTDSSSSTSNTPSIVAGRSNSTLPPALTSSLTS